MSNANNNKTALKIAADNARNATNLEALNDALVTYEEAFQAADDVTREADEINDWSEIGANIDYPEATPYAGNRSDVVAVSINQMIVSESGYKVMDRDDI